jgi:hypothetical protein
MEGEHDEALEEFLTAFDRRLRAAPVVDRRDRMDRRAQPAGLPFDGRRSRGPVTEPFAYWEADGKKSDRKD